MSDDEIFVDVWYNFILNCGLTDRGEETAGKLGRERKGKEVE